MHINQAVISSGQWSYSYPVDKTAGFWRGPAEFDIRCNPRRNNMYILRLVWFFYNSLR